MSNHEFEDEDEFVEALVKAMSEPINSDEPSLVYWGCLFNVKIPKDEASGVLYIPEELEFSEDV